MFSEVAKELGLSVLIVREIFNTHSLYTRKVMESSSFDGVRWPHFGAFKSKPKEVQFINHMRGLTPEQQEEFKQQVREGKFKVDRWQRSQKRRQNPSKGVSMDKEQERDDTI